MWIEIFLSTLYSIGGIVSTTNDADHMFLKASQAIARIVDRIRYRVLRIIDGIMISVLSKDLIEHIVNAVFDRPIATFLAQCFGCIKRTR